MSGAPIGDPAVLGVGYTPAKPDSYVTLYATGLGAVNPSFQPGVPPDGIANTINPVTVSVNGSVLSKDEVLYAGVAPGYPGLYQINVHIPATMPDGDLAVAVEVASFTTPPGAFLTVRQ